MTLQIPYVTMFNLIVSQQFPSRFEYLFASGFAATILSEFIFHLNATHRLRFVANLVRFRQMPAKHTLASEQLIAQMTLQIPHVWMSQMAVAQQFHASRTENATFFTLMEQLPLTLHRRHRLAGTVIISFEFCRWLHNAVESHLLHVGLFEFFRQTIVLGRFIYNRMRFL